MIINPLDAHDRYLITKKEENIIQKGFEDCRYRNPLALAMLEYSDYIYVFAHKREVQLDEKITKFNQDLNESLINLSYIRKYRDVKDVPSFRILWQPRLTKPTPQENSFLFRAEKNNNDIDVYWIIPPSELWGQNKKGNMTEDPIITESIHLFKTNREQLSAPHDKDLPLEKVKQILKIICKKRKKKKFNPIDEMNSANNFKGLIL